MTFVAISRAFLQIFWSGSKFGITEPNGYFEGRDYKDCYLIRFWKIRNFPMHISARIWFHLSKMTSPLRISLRKGPLGEFLMGIISTGILSSISRERRRYFKARLR